MTRGAIVLLSVVFGAWVLAGCGQSDAPAAASTPAVPLRNLNVVKIPPNSPQIKQIRVEPVRLADLPSDELVAPGRVAMNPNRVSRVLPGLSLREAVVQGAHVQFRPRLVLIVVAVLGMLPAALARGIGSDIQRPLAAVVVGGLLATLILNLFAPPAIYGLAERLRTVVRQVAE